MAVRKYRLCLTLPHQYVDQIPLPIRQAVVRKELKDFFRQAGAD